MPTPQELEFMKETDIPDDNDDEGGEGGGGRHGRGDADDEDEQRQQQLDGEISLLRVQVKQFPYHYESHQQFIDTLRAAGPHHRDELRYARERCSETFPLPEGVWLQWLEDEQEALGSAAKPEARSGLVKLFERALADFNTPTLWIRYLTFLMADVARDNPAMGVKDVRGVFERAVTTMGAHISEGHIIWTMYILFETEHADDTLAAVQKLYRRQLTVPHLTYDETLEAYKAFEEQRNAAEKDAQLATLKSTIDKALKETEARKPYEAALEASSDSLPAYLSYIDFETHQRQPDPFRVRVLFERCVAKHSLQPHVWVKYTDFLDHHVKIASVLRPVHVRATRNCSWSGDVWASYLRALERLGAPKEEIDDVYHRGRGSNFQTGDELAKLHVAYVDYVRRCAEKDEAARATSHEALRPALEYAINHVAQYFSGGDPYCQLERYRVRMEVLHWKDLARAREQYESLLKAYPRSADLWLEFARLERLVGDRTTAQALYRRGVSSRSDDMRLFGEALEFEREEGTLESYDLMAQRVQTQMNLLEQQQQRETEKAEKAAAEAAAAADARKSDKRKRGQGEDAGGAKRARTVGAHGAGPAKDAGSADANAMDVDGQASSAKPEPPKNPYRDASQQERSVFVSNLAFSVTEERLLSVLSSSGEIESVVLTRDPRNNNASKGYGTVTFVSKESAAKAILRDRERLDGRPMYVSKFVSARPGARREQFPTTADEKTVFVSQLPFSADEKRLEAVFQQYGELKQVRLAIRKTGLSKGFAYIEYSDEMAARRALDMDGKDMDGQTISVKMSNPPGKRGPGGGGGGGGGSADQPAPEAARTPATTLMPRQVMRRPLVAVSSVPSSATTAAPAPAAGAPNAGARKSQDDFRAMLSKK